MSEAHAMAPGDHPALSPLAGGAALHEVPSRSRADETYRAWRRRAAQRIRGVLQDPARSLRLDFQPIVDLGTGARAGVEALARFTVPPHRGPALWFAEAWEVGLGIELDLAVARVALGHLARVSSGQYLSLNLSPVTLVSPEFRKVLTQIDASRLVVEVTETAPIEDIRGVDPCLRALRARGGRLAVDDAGAGYSGLHRILRLGPEFIKLDMLITRDVDSDPARRALARALVSFSEEVGAVLVAEGIESAAEAGVLRDLGVPYGQGYFLGRPGPLVDATGEVPTGEDAAS